ncbi:ADP-ribosyltransferase domain-containing protein [Enterobacter sp. 22466]|uniref:ADP-ribosyltransferase domain-containing protein n=1 Tax=Enterobacter sp. 22466 TaxID=3453924 RepID=UPI003F832CF6
MSINSVGNPVASMKSIPQGRVKLSETRCTLTNKIKDITNSAGKLKISIAEHKRGIDGNQSLLKSLKSVSAIHGENASVRLKNGHYKYAQASNFLKNVFNGNRYQIERNAAAKTIGAKGSAVSAGMVIKTLQSKIDSATSDVNRLNKEVAIYHDEIGHLKAEKKVIETKLEQLIEIDTDKEKADEKNHNIRQHVSSIYQTNAGCKAINTVARHLFRGAPSGGKVSGDAVINEYRSVLRDDIFNHGNKELEKTIRSNCSNLSKLVNTGAQAWYTPTRDNITTYRGQGITQSGINTLISQFNADKQKKTDTVYNLGQFFSTSKSKDVAHDFANSSPDDIKVIFTVKGNSSHGLSIPGGLVFENYEGERLYSPLANFKVTAAKRVESNTYRVTLEEVTKGGMAQPLPY